MSSDNFSNSYSKSSSSDAIISFSSKDLKDLVTELESDIDGLSLSSVREKQIKFGKNEIGTNKKTSVFFYLWNSYFNPFNILLSVLVLISYLTSDFQGTVVIATMVVIATLVRFFQEFSSSKALEKLKSMVRSNVTVFRKDSSENTVKNEIPLVDLVPGDIVILSAGDMIPSDLRIINAKDLFLNQAALTGEAMPIEKVVKFEERTKSKSIFDLSNIAFMGSNVVSGSAIAIVLKTGRNTYFGRLTNKVVSTGNVSSQFTKGINQTTKLLIYFMILMVPIVLVINGITKGDWFEASLFALSVAVGLTPEMLPMIVTSTLARGAIFMSEKKVIVKRLEAIQNLGAMDVLCTDKTGTLTQDKIVLKKYTDIYGETYSKVLEYTYLNSYYQTGLKNLLDLSVLEHSELETSLNIKADYSKIDEIPYDFKRRRMSVVVSEKKNKHILICKGAIEEIVGISSKAIIENEVFDLDEKNISKIYEFTNSLSNEGFRVVALAVKEFPTTKTIFSLSDESDLTLFGYVAFLDPPKETAGPALKALKNSRVNVKILTGDNELVTKKICRDIGFKISKLIYGKDIDNMSEDQLLRAVRTSNVFVKLSPDHKEKIVETLRKQDFVVGFMGDGINDAPSLKAADVGISVDSAVDIAKEAADIILLEKSLMVLKVGIIEGRKTFANMLKYIKMAASSNFGNVFSILIASIFLPFLPMLPIHLLIQNLLYDLSQAAIPFDNVDKESLMKPKKWDPRDIRRFMIFFGPISSIFDVSTFCIMWFIFNANTLENQNLFQTGWFVEGLISQTLIVHMIRTRKIPFLESISSFPLLVSTLFIMFIGIMLPFSSFAVDFKMVPLPLSYFLYLVPILFLYIFLTQIVKNIYSKLYGWK